MLLKHYLADKPGFEFKDMTIRPRSDRMKTTNVTESIAILNKFSSVRAAAEPESVFGLTSCPVLCVAHRNCFLYLEVVAVDIESIEMVLDSIIRGVAFPTEVLLPLLNASVPEGVNAAQNLDSYVAIWLRLFLYICSYLVLRV